MTKKYNYDNTLKEKVKNNDYTDRERDQYRLFRFCSYEWVKLKDTII